MRSFIPSIEEPADSDESGDEIPPGGVFPQVEDEEAAEDAIVGILAGVVNDIGGPENDGMGEEEEDEDEDGSLADDSDLDDDDDDENFVEMSSDSDSGPEEDAKAGDDEDDDDDDSDSDASDKDKATMESVFGIAPNVKEADAPLDVEDASDIVDIHFHPKFDLISAATMAGDVITYKYGVGSIEEVARYTYHKESCRALRYSHDGSSLYTISKDQSLAIVDTQNSSVRHTITDAHNAPIYSLTPIDTHTCATGDDEGTVKIWDLRTHKSVFDFKCGEETVTSLLTSGAKKVLAASVGDGSIAGFNIRAKRLEVQSEMYDSEMNTMCLVRDETKLVVGSGEGHLYIYNWGDFGYHVDQFKGIKNEVLCTLTIADKLILAGTEDGNIRAVHLYPHRFVGVVGEHRSFGVSSMSLCHEGKYVASCSHDGVVRFWNINYLYDMSLKPRGKLNKQRAVHKLKSSRQRNSWEFFKDLPKKLDSSDDEAGPVAGPSNDTKKKEEGDGEEGEGDEEEEEDDEDMEDSDSD